MGVVPDLGEVRDSGRSIGGLQRLVRVEARPLRGAGDLRVGRDVLPFAEERLV